MGFEVVSAAYHRNGVGGAPFKVAIVNDDETGRMLVIDFSRDDDDQGLMDTEYTAVINLDLAAGGNIFMHPQLDETGKPIPDTGDNAWRGDVMGGEYRQAIAAHIYQWREGQMAAWQKRNEQTTEQS